MRNRPGKKHADNKPNKTGQPPPPPQANSAPAVNPQPNGQGSHKNRCRKLRKAPVWIEALCAVALVIITAFYTHYASQQVDAAIKAAKAAESAANTARDSLIANSRAWIAPANAGFTSELVRNVPFSWEVQYRNTGRSPALDVHPIWNLQQVPVSMFDNNTFNPFIESDKASETCKNLGTAPGADVAYPDQPDGYKLIFTNHLTDWINDDIISGKTAVVLQMCFAYKTLGEVHHTSFCYFYRVGISPLNRQMNICTAGNHAD